MSLEIWKYLKKIHLGKSHMQRNITHTHTLSARLRIVTQDYVWFLSTKESLFLIGSWQTDAITKFSFYYNYTTINFFIFNLWGKYYRKEKKVYSVLKF